MKVTPEIPTNRTTIRSMLMRRAADMKKPRSKKKERQPLFKKLSKRASWRFPNLKKSLDLSRIGLRGNEKDQEKLKRNI